MSAVLDTVSEPAKPAKPAMVVAPRWEPETEKPPGLWIERVPENDLGALMGKAWRNSITGKVHLKDYGFFPDFSVVDLWTSGSLCGSADQLSKNPYLFRPVPLLIRTWIYHCIFRLGRVLSVTGADEDGMIKYVLSQSVIDAPVSGGRWSPITFHAPLLIFLCITGDLLLILGATFVLVMILAIGWHFNTPELYRWTRAATLPFRLALLALLILRMQQDEMTGASKAGSLFGFLIGCACVCLEILIGDLSALASVRLHCSYTVLRSLPNRVFICQRVGAAGSERLSTTSPPVDQKITGIGEWQVNMALIADVKGLIVELRPMGKVEWAALFEELLASNEPSELCYRFIGLDLYSPSAATVDALNATLQEQHIIAAKNKQRLEWWSEEQHEKQQVAPAPPIKSPSARSTGGGKKQQSMTRQPPPPRHPGAGRIVVEEA